jgi:hypothetical protein
MNVRTMNAESIARALDAHVREGRLSNWQMHSEGGWLIWPNRHEAEHLRSKRDIAILLLGLTSAGYAPDVVLTQRTAR